jgi:hypothetical protein
MVLAVRGRGDGAAARRRERNPRGGGELGVECDGEGPLPDYKALTAKYGERFQAQDMQAVVPQVSGLVGVVRLVGR